MSMDLNEQSEMEQAAELASRPLLTVLFSAHRDVYKIPSCRADLWLSVAVYQEDEYNHVKVQTADGRAYRRAYRGSPIFPPAPPVTLPADDPLVVDYLHQAKAEEL